MRVICNGTTLATLTALPDPNAASDAADCRQAVYWCRQTTAASPYGASGAAIKVVKQVDKTWSYTGRVCLAPARPQVTVADVRDRVVRLVPGSALQLAPRAQSLVNVQTVMWVDAPAQRALAPIEILGRQVRVTLTVDQVFWDFGDGVTVTSEGAGRAYDRVADPCGERMCPGYFGHVYGSTGTMAVQATVSWTARFTVDGGAAVTIPGTVDGPTANQELTVLQARTELVPDPDR